MRKNETKVYWLPIFFLFLVPLLSCSPSLRVLTRSRLLMGHVPVTIQIKIHPQQKDKALRATEGAYELASRLESKISEYQPESEISCLNQNAGKKSCPLSPDVLELLLKAKELSLQTGGAFDLRFASPSHEARNGEIHLDPKQGLGKLSHPRTRIGVGAIGKGFIVDRMVQYLQDQGLDEVMVQAGGDLLGVGSHWEVGIQIPQGAPGKYRETFAISGEALATSGTYELGNHILEPQSRRPVKNGKSVTVRAKDLTTADALSTAFFVMGEKESLKYLKQFPEVKIYWVDPDGTQRSYP